MLFPFLSLVHGLVFNFIQLFYQLLGSRNMQCNFAPIPFNSIIAKHYSHMYSVKGQNHLFRAIFSNISSFGFYTKTSYIK